MRTSQRRLLIAALTLHIAREQSPDPILSDAEATLLKAFRHISKAFTDLKADGASGPNRYAYLTTKSILSVLHSDTSKGIQWKSDYIPKLKSMSEGDGDLAEVANLWYHYLSLAKKAVGGIAAAHGKVPSEKMWNLLGRLRRLGEEATNQALVLSRTSKQRSTVLRYVLRVSKATKPSNMDLPLPAGFELKPLRGGWPSFNIYIDPPIGHSEPFFKKKFKIDVATKWEWILEEGNVEMKSVKGVWTGNKLRPDQFNIGEDGTFRTNPKNAWKTIRVHASLPGQRATDVRPQYQNQDYE